MLLCRRRGNFLENEYVDRNEEYCSVSASKQLGGFNVSCGKSQDDEMVFMITGTVALSVYDIVHNAGIQDRDRRA